MLKYQEIGSYNIVEITGALKTSICFKTLQISLDE